MDCKQCKKGKLTERNNYPYSTIVITYYKCSNCGYEIKVTAPKETWRRLKNEK